MTTYIALVTLAIIIIAAVVILVRRERRNRDIEKRALVHAIVDIDRNNEIRRRSASRSTPA